MKNKDIAKNFLKLAAAGKVDEAYEKYVDKKFIHHNVWYPHDRQSLMDGMKDSDKKMPNKKFIIKKILEEKDTVATHSYIKMKMKGKVWEGSVVHIVKIKNGKIVEMWDIGQEIPKDSPNRKGAF
ncbi:MAG TPA: ester cyclase [Alphaproteobacteria bacterium]|nr:ester cyclase [Alphaproteobacteria bacterium]